MVDNLKGIQRPIDLPYQKKPFLPLLRPYSVDIASIYTIGIHLNIIRLENEIFRTSLYEINRILEEQYKEANPIELDIEPSLPVAYYKYQDITSKKALDTLLLYQSYDYQIYLEGLSTLSFSPLYKIITKELKEVK